MKRIAIDAMGGEHAPEAVIKAVLKVRQELPQTKFILFGDKEKLRTLLPASQINEQLEVVPTTQVIEDQDEPVQAMRQKKDSSMVRAAHFVKEGRADALFSMGNTGSLLACGIFIVGRIRGIARPALMPTIPVANSDRGFNLIDVGANAESKPAYFLQWAQMASYYATKIRGVQMPRVALLNNGAESDKGDNVHQKAYQILDQSDLNFIGNIEGNELLSGKTDVAVMDGFSGNIALKSIEGVAQILFHSLKDSLLNNGLLPKVGALLSKKALKQLQAKYDTARYGGAVLLGVQAPVIKTHGRSTSRPVYYTLKQIDKMLDEHLVADFTSKFAPARKQDK